MIKYPFMEEIDSEKYPKTIPKYITERCKHSPTNMLKTILFEFTMSGYIFHFENWKIIAK